MAGILFKLSGLTLPTAVASVTKSMGNAVSPVIIFLLGAFLEFGGFKKYRKPIIVTSVIRLVIAPALMLTAAAIVPVIGIVGNAGADAARAAGHEHDAPGEEVAPERVPRVGAHAARRSSASTSRGRGSGSTAP